VSRPVVSGLVPADRNASVNAALARLSGANDGDAVTCDGSETAPWWSDASVVIEAQVPGYLALGVSASGYSGGAHPIGGGHCVLLDTHTGREASLMATLGPAVMAAIGKETLTQLHAFRKSNELGEGDEDSTALSSLDDAHVCYVDATRVEVRYSPYEVAPYAFGAPSFSIATAPLVARMPPSAARRALFGQ
jgi:hypothetical protein